MSVDDLPELNPPAFGDIVDADRPVLSFAWRRAEAHRAAAHRHARAHIILPLEGACWAVTPQGTWLVPTGQGLWIPPWVHHEIYSRGPFAARMIFVDPAHTGRLPQRAGTVEVSALLAELVRRAVAYGNDYAPAEAEARLAQVMLDELALMQTAPLLLPFSREPRLVRAMDRLVTTPSADVTLEEAARGASASARTLARLFRSEIGMTFSQWKTRLLLVEAIDRLARGASVTEVALDLGYSTTSSFVYMFRSNLGVSPGTYRRDRGAAGARAGEERPNRTET